MDWMKEAVLLAKQAFLADEVPVAALVVREGKKIASSFNKTNTSASAHAEMIVLEEAQKILAKRYLYDCDIYVTLEPCVHYGKTPPCTN